MTRKLLYSQKLSENTVMEAVQNEGGKNVRIDIHQSHVGCSLVLNPDELKALREFIDTAITLSTPFELAQPPAWEEVQAERWKRDVQRMYEI